MTIFEHLDAMTPYIQRRDWSALEAEYHRLATELVGQTLAESIAGVDTTEYQAALKSSLAQVYKAVSGEDYAAIYFEYNLDNRWDGAYFLCGDYSPLSEFAESGNDDWACEFDDSIEGPGFPPFAKIYASVPGFDGTDKEMGTTLYLVARTVAAFGRASADFKGQQLALCIGFHEQDPIVRIFEP